MSDRELQEARREVALAPGDGAWLELRMEEVKGESGHLSSGGESGAEGRRGELALRAELRV